MNPTDLFHPAVAEWFDRSVRQGVNGGLADETQIVYVSPLKALSNVAISLERLAALCGGPLLRIGLSATQKPVEAVTRFLVGRSGECGIIDTGHRRARDLALEGPASPLEAALLSDLPAGRNGWPPPAAPSDPPRPISGPSTPEVPGLAAAIR